MAIDELAAPDVLGVSREEGVTKVYWTDVPDATMYEIDGATVARPVVERDEEDRMVGKTWTDTGRTKTYNSHAPLFENPASARIRAVRIGHQVAPTSEDPNPKDLQSDWTAVPAASAPKRPAPTPPPPPADGDDQHEDDA